MNSRCVKDGVLRMLCSVVGGPLMVTPASEEALTYG